jgi:hypothetical protein
MEYGLHSGVIKRGKPGNPRTSHWFGWVRWENHEMEDLQQTMRIEAMNSGWYGWVCLSWWAKKSTIRFWGTFSDKPNMRIVYRKCWFWVNKRTKITRTYHPRKQDANVFRKNLFHLGREPWSFWVPRKYRNLFAPSPKRRCIRGPRWRTIFQNLDWWVRMGILFSWLLIASLAQETF